MYLKSMELHGFKSFPDKTVLKFNNGTTVIVGPNGSGKSNMTDAMRWVLGELSSKNIRGNKMDDVIFAGADGKKPMSFAEVAVTFDDSEEPKVLNTTYDEVTVARRYYRSGESEYFINKKKIRLKDIYEMFMNTGIGREGYSIIGQGRIAEIISKKSEDRRGVFEESAGISKFRYRKTESERKLAETEANMARVEDIEKELASRLGPLEKDSEKARKYLEYYGEKKKIDISLWLYDIDKIKSSIEKASLDTNMSAHELEIADDNIKQTDEKIDRLYNQSHSSKELSQKNHEKLAETVKLKSDSEAQLLVYNNTIVNIESRIEAEKSAAGTIQETLKKERNNAEAVFESSMELKNSYDKAAEKLNSAVERYNYAVNSVNEKLSEIECSQTAKKSTEDELTDLRIKLNVISETLKNADTRKKNIEADIERYTGESSILKADCESKSEKISDYTKQITELDEECLEYQKQIDSFAAEETKLRIKLSLKKADIDSHNSRIVALKNMHEHFEGYYNSVRYVMREKDKIGGIHGPISYLIKADPEYVVAVETALGASLQNIVTEDEASAKRAIQSLKNSNSGRATFYPITTIKYHGQSREFEGVSEFKGFIGYADKLISYDARYDDIMKSLLANTAVFDTLDNASDMARAKKWRIKAVTLDGQQINSGGSFTGGQTKRDSGTLTRSNQIDDLVKETALLESEASDVEGELNSVLGKNADTAMLIEALNVKKADLQKELAELQSEYNNFVSRENMLNELIGNLKNDADELSAGYSEAENQLTQIKALCELDSDKIAELEAHINALLIEKAEIQAEADSLNNSANNMRVKCAELARDKEALDNSYEEIMLRIKARESELESHMSKLADFKSEIEKLSVSVTEKQNDISGFDNEIKRLNKQQLELSDTADKIDAELSSLRIKQKEYTAKKELVFIAHSKNEAKLAELKNQHEKNSEQLWQNYELTYSSAVNYASENNCETVDDKSKASFITKQNVLKNQIKELGNINLNSIDEYAEIKKRYDYIKIQLDDLRESKREIEKILAELETDMRRMFVEAFEKINLYFGEVFRELFGGGNAEVVLTDPENVLSSGIEINAAPPGKSIKNLNLLSGGEQSFIAIALMFALVKVNPSPFCIFDEIEAALDEVNVTRVGRYIKKYSEEMQIIMITHRRGTMEIADTLYGVTMQQSGVSRVFTLDAESDKDKVSEN